MIHRSKLIVGRRRLCRIRIQNCSDWFLRIVTHVQWNIITISTIIIIISIIIIIITNVVLILHFRTISKFFLKTKEIILKTQILGSQIVNNSGHDNKTENRDDEAEPELCPSKQNGVVHAKKLFVRRQLEDAVHLSADGSLAGGVACRLAVGVDEGVVPLLRSETTAGRIVEVGEVVARADGARTCVLRVNGDEARIFFRVVGC